MKNESTNLAIKIKKKRTEIGLSQKELARFSGISQQHVSAIENGNLSPTLATLSKVLYVLGWELAFKEIGMRGIESKLAGLRRFNAWEASQEVPVGFSRALEEAEQLRALAGNLGGAGSREGDLALQAEAWKSWRARLPKK